MAIQQRRGWQAPNAQAMIPEIDPNVAALSRRASEQLSMLPSVFYPDDPQEKALVDGGAQEAGSNADGMRGWSAAPGSMNDQYASMGFADNVPRSLIGTESGGRWGARNNEIGSGGASGHYGILQFGQARYSEAVAAGAVPRGMSIEQFGSDTEAGRQAQISASNWHFSDIDKRIKGAGFDRLIGSTIGGTPVTWDGMRSMAHLGGFGGLARFMNTGGRYNPSDSFGTSLSAYGRTHSAR